MCRVGEHPHGLASRVAGKVAEVERLGSLFRLTVEAPGWIGALPGQFAMLQAERSHCFLPRAFSVAGQDQGAVSFLIAPVGAATLELQALSPGTQIWVTGPLGNGFDVEALLGTSAGRMVIVAGGVGVAPFAPLVDSLRGSKFERVEVLALVGFRDAAQAEGMRPLAAALSHSVGAGLACRSVVALEDGSVGPPRRVTDLLAEELRPDDRVVVCGPPAMCRAVWDICQERGTSKVWFSLESSMACGVGSCHGCVVDLADGSTARVCREGPVFAGAAMYGGRHE